MRTSWKTLAAVAASLVLAPSLASADEVADQLKLMQERMSQMEDRLQATNDQLKVAEGKVSEQQVVIEQAGLAEERGAQSALSSFLSETEFGGAVAASYFWNTENPPGGVRGGLGPISNPFQQNNTFQFDEFSLSVGRAADEPHSAGFQFDIMFGETAQVLGNGDAGVGAAGGGNALWINNAYIEYNTGWGDTRLIAGKFGTHIGYETAQAADNINITRGFTYNLLQPIDQVGVKLQGGMNGFSWMIGGANGAGTNQIDTDRGKDLIGSIGYGTDKFSTSVNIEWGTDAEFNTIGGVSSRKSDILIVDSIFELTPTEDLVAWLDLTYTSVLLNNFGDPYGVGIAVGSRYAFTDKFGLAGRFEYGHFDSRGTGVAFFPGQMSDEIDLYSFTLTADYRLADGLVLKLEGKYEAATDASGTAVGAPPVPPGVDPENIFPGNDNEQFIIGAQMVYSF